MAAGGRNDHWGVHICNASDSDIESCADKRVFCWWQLIKMPTAPLIRLEPVIVDNPAGPHKFESFLDTARKDQARVLAQLANQDQLHLASCGDRLSYRFAKMVSHDEQQWQYLHEQVAEAIDRRIRIPPEQRDFGQAKAEFMSRFV